jgi:hypothetical protein
MRSRNLKPGFFKNEALAECSPLARLLFAGLWCLADREGRLEDRPKRIRAELLPYDDGSVDDLLTELHEAGFILRYAAASGRFIQVVNFGKHQNPHHREADSTIPAPDKPEASLGLSPDKPDTSPELAVLIPDSLNLIPDSLIHGSGAGAPVVASKLADLTPCPHQEIIDAYHEALPASPRIRDWTKARAAHLQARWREDPKRQTVEWWHRLFAYVAESDFLTGRVATDGRKPFTASLEWLLKPENFAKVREGRYHDGGEA